MVANITLLLKEGMQSKEIGDIGRVHGAVLRELHWQSLVVGYSYHAPTEQSTASGTLAHV